MMTNVADEMHEGHPHFERTLAAGQAFIEQMARWYGNETKPWSEAPQQDRLGLAKSMHAGLALWKDGNPPLPI